MGQQWSAVGSAQNTTVQEAQKIGADGDCSHEIRKCLLFRKKAMTNLSRVLKKQRHHFADKGLYSQSYGFSISHVQM